MSENNLKDFISVNSDLGHIQKSKKKRERGEGEYLRSSKKNPKIWILPGLSPRCHAAHQTWYRFGRALYKSSLAGM